MQGVISSLLPSPKILPFSQFFFHKIEEEGKVHPGCDTPGFIQFEAEGIQTFPSPPQEVCPNHQF